MQAAQSSQGSVDMISNLPQDVMNLVLMCLPISEAVSTSIFSKKWRFKWISIPDIVFDEDCLLEGASVKEHANAVDHVLLNHVGSIRKFSCLFYVPSCSHIDGWIMFLSRNPINKLILKIRVNDYYDAPFISKEVFYDVPSHIFYYQELCHLELLHCTLKVPYTFKGFRNLRVLNLESFKIGFIELAFLILRSPLLERLTLKDLCIYRGCIIIHALNLHYLEVAGNSKIFHLQVHV